MPASLAVKGMAFGDSGRTSRAQVGREDRDTQAAGLRPGRRPYLVLDLPIVINRRAVPCAAVHCDSAADNARSARCSGTPARSLSQRTHSGSIFLTASVTGSSIQSPINAS